MFERNHWIWWPLAWLLLMLILAAPVGGRIDNPRMASPGGKYYSGTIEAVNRHTCEICRSVELSVILITRAGPLEVRLGPQTFFEKHDFHLSAGDAIEVTGREFAERGRNLVLANEVRKADKCLILRGKYGKPAWIEAHGYTCPVCGN